MSITVPTRSTSSADEPPVPPDPTPEPARPRRRRRRRVLVAAVITLTVLVAAPVSVGLYVGHQLSSRITRLDGLFPPAAERPAHVASGPAAGALNVLLLGTDRRSDVPTTGSDAGASSWVPGAQRSDTMMVLHIDADRRGASVVSIPRDSWVDVPGHGTAKINAAYSWGGPALAVAAVERLTGVRMDHVAIVDWDGYKAMIDSLGGVDVTVPRTVHDSYRDTTWTAGRHHLDGAGALLYARERAGLPAGDLDRTQRQQAVLRALSRGVAQHHSSPTAVYRLLASLTRHLTVDSSWSGPDMTKLALALRGLGPSDVSYLNIPVTGTGMVGDQSVVFVDRDAGRGLWRAVRADRMGDWTQDHRDLLTADVVR